MDGQVEPETSSRSSGSTGMTELSVDGRVSHLLSEHPCNSSVHDRSVEMKEPNDHHHHQHAADADDDAELC